MAQAPMAMPDSMPPDPSADTDAGSGDNVLVTICGNGDGSYTVYAGDESSDDGGMSDMSEDDADLGPDAASPAPTGAPAASGQPADSIGAALKIALDILQGDASSQGGPGNADSQLADGFSASQSPTPASGPQKY